jgi:hypothetical protein
VSQGFARIRALGSPTHEAADVRVAFQPIPDIDSRTRVRVLWLLVAALAALGALEFRELVQFQPLGVDFLPLWTAGRMSWTHPGQVYDFATVSHAQDWLLPGVKWMRPYAYPPTALLLLAPFGVLPFWPALGLWVALGLGVFLYAGARLATGRLTLNLALMALSPAVLLAAMVGQSVLPAAALMVLAMVELEKRPRLAGAFLALAAAIKPQAVLLAPIALISGGAFEALASAAVVEALLVGASVALFGFDRWSEWFASLPAFEAVVQTSPGLISGVITPNGAAQQLGVTGVAATIWRAAFALFGIVLVWLAFRRRGDASSRLAALAAGSLLAAPYAMHYDGALLAPAAAVMAVQSLEQRGWIWRLLALCAVCEVILAYLGLPMVVAFAVLSSFRLQARPTAAPAARLSPDSDATVAGTSAPCSG